MWVSIDSEAACSAALQQSFLDFGIVDNDSLQLVLQFDGASLARALCIALQAASPEALPSAAEHAAMITVMDEALSSCRLELEEMEASVAVAHGQLKSLSVSVHVMEAELANAEKRAEAAEARRRAAQEAAKAADKQAARTQHRQAAATAEERAVMATEKERLAAKEVSAKELLVQATKRFEAAQELIEMHQAGKERAAADASAAEAAQMKAAADRKIAEAAVARSSGLEGAATRAAALEQDLACEKANAIKAAALQKEAEETATALQAVLQQQEATWEQAAAAWGAERQCYVRDGQQTDALWVQEEVSWAVAQKCYKKALLETEREVGDVIRMQLVRAAVLSTAGESLGPQFTPQAVPAAQAPCAGKGTHNLGRGGEAKGMGAAWGKGGRGGRGHDERVSHLPSRSHAALAATLD